MVLVEACRDEKAGRAGEKMWVKRLGQSQVHDQGKGREVNYIRIYHMSQDFHNQ